jgi:hypothetical protein
MIFGCFAAAFSMLKLKKTNARAKRLKAIIMYFKNGFIYLAVKVDN